MAEVFISYKSEDYDKAAWVRKTLEANGISVWMAPESIPGGSSYAAAIPEAIHEARFVVLVASSETQKSIWIPRELDQAINENKIVLPFFLEDVPLEKDFGFYLRNVQHYNAFEDICAAMDAMIRDIYAVMYPGVPVEKGWRQPEKQPEEKKAAGKRGWLKLLIPIILVALIALGVAVFFYFGGNRKPVSSETTTGDPSSEAATTEPAETTEAQILAEGECGKQGDNVKWTLYSDGTLTLIGTGETADYMKRADVPWNAYLDKILRADVQSGVTTIGNNLFSGCAAMENAALPETLEKIGMFSFQSCAALTGIGLPASLTDLDAYAFCTCRNLSEIRVAEGNPAFEVKDGALYSKDGKTLYRVPAAYNGALIVYEGVETFNTDCFCCSGVASVLIPKSLKEVKPFAIDDCLSLKMFVSDGENPSFTVSGDGVLFSKEEDVLIAFPTLYGEDTYEVPDTVEEIAATAFCNTNLKKIVIPDSVEKIGRNVVTQAQSDITLTFLGDAPEFEKLPEKSRDVTVTIEYSAATFYWEELIATDTEQIINWVSVD